MDNNILYDMTTGTESKKQGVMTKCQKQYILQFVEDHPNLKSGKFTQNFTFKSAQSLWKELADVLNTMPGCKKDWLRWRKTWHDMKNAAKAKGATIKQYQSATGGGPPITVQLIPEGERILGMIAPVAIEGHHVLESQATFTSNAPVQEDEACESSNSTTALRDKEGKDRETIDQTINQEHAEKKSRRPRVHRLNKTIAVSDRMTEQMERKITIRNNYFNRKLVLMDNDVAAKMRIAAAWESIVQALQPNKKICKY